MNGNRFIDCLAEEFADVGAGSFGNSDDTVGALDGVGNPLAQKLVIRGGNDFGHAQECQVMHGDYRRHARSKVRKREIG